MDSYRPRDYDSQPPRNGYERDMNNQSDDFKIRGRAGRRHASRSRSPAPSRRVYRDPDAPPRTMRDEYYPHQRNDDQYDSRYSNSSDYYTRDYAPRDYHVRERRAAGRHSRDYVGPEYYSQGQYEQQSLYDERKEPPASRGDEDLSRNGSPMRFLLIRDLKPNMGEEVFSKGLEKLYSDADAQPVAQPGKPEGAPLAPLSSLPAPPGRIPVAEPVGASPGSLSRVYLIRDRQTHKALSYGFAEYHNLADAKGALAKAQQLGPKCSISSQQIRVDWPHTGIFLPTELVDHCSKDDIEFSFSINQDQRHIYRDRRYYASVRDINERPSPQLASQPLPPDDAKVKIHKKRSNTSQAVDTIDSSGTQTKKARPVALAIAETWGRKQAELHGEDADNASTLPKAGAQKDPNTGEHPQSYIIDRTTADKVRRTCLLCCTDLPPTLSPEKHVEGSTKHAASLKDDGAVKLALDRLKQHGVAENETIKVVIEAPEAPAAEEYRDRARERREQVAKSEERISVSLAHVVKRGGSGSNATAVKDALPLYGKGQSILAKAGWTEGQGLGAGTGIAAPIEQNLYAAGVGLGHEESKQGDAVEVAAKMTKGDRDSFLESTKETARRRFLSMQ